MGDSGMSCPHCRADDVEVVVDDRAGEIICAKCGAVLMDHVIDEHSEWRTFSEHDHDTEDPNRVGAVNNPLLNDPGLSTIIGKTDAAGGATGSDLARLHGMGTLNSLDRNLKAAFDRVARMAQRISLPEAVRQQVNELYKKVEEQEKAKGWSMDVIVAACFYSGCRLANVPRTFKEVCALLPDVKKLEVGRCYLAIKKRLNLDMGVVDPAQLVLRYCSKLNLSKEVSLSAKHVAEEAFKRGIGASRSPVSRSAAAIYLATQLSSSEADRRSIEDIAARTEVKAPTIRTAYNEFYRHCKELTPRASLERLARPV